MAAVCPCTALTRARCPWSLIHRPLAELFIDADREADLPRIFEPFFTTPSAKAPAWASLSQAWGLARQHGGGLRVESRPGQGATLALYLPAWQPGAPSPARNLPEAGDSIAGRRHAT